MGVSSDRNAKGPGQPKVCQLQVIVLVVYEQVLRLQILMEHLTQHAPRKVARSHPEVDLASQALQNDPGWTSRLIGVIKTGMNRSIISTLRKSAQTTLLMLRQIQKVLLFQNMCMLDYCDVGC